MFRGSKNLEGMGSHIRKLSIIHVICFILLCSKNSLRSLLRKGKYSRWTKWELEKAYVMISYIFLIKNLLYILKLGILFV